MLQPLDEVRVHFEVNVVGLISVTQALLPLLRAKSPRTHEPGRILNIGSVGGKVALPFIGPYAGTKHAVEGISGSLRRELLPYGIDVIVIEPGSVSTEVWDKGASGAERYADTDYAEPLARFGEYAQRLAKNGFSPEQFGQFVREASRRGGRRPGTLSCLASSPISPFQGLCPTAGWTGSSRGTSASHITDAQRSGTTGAGRGAAGPSGRQGRRERRR